MNSTVDFNRRIRLRCQEPIMVCRRGAGRASATLLAVAAVATLNAYAQGSEAPPRAAGVEPPAFELRLAPHLGVNGSQPPDLPTADVRARVAVPATALSGGGRIAEVPQPAGRFPRAAGEPERGIAPISSSRERTVAAIVRDAVLRHPAVQSAAATQDERVLLRQAIEGTAYPQISAGINPGIAGGSTTQRRALTVGLNQRISDFGRTQAKEEEAQAQVDSQTAALSSTASDIALQLVEATIGVQRGHALARIYDAWVADVSRLLDMARDRATSGVTSQADPTQAAARVSAAFNARAQAATALGKETSRLRLLLAGTPSVEELRHAPLPGNLVVFAAAADAISAREVPSVQRAQADYRAAQARVQSAKASFRPTLALEMGLSQPISQVYGGAGAMSGHYAMVTLKSDLFDGGVRSSQVGAALRAEQAALANVENARLAAESEAARFRHDFENAVLSFKLAADQKKNLFSTLGRYRDQYTIGARSILDLLNTEQEAYLASIAETNADFDRHLTAARIAQSAGRLLELLEITINDWQALAVVGSTKDNDRENRQ